MRGQQGLRAISCSSLSSCVCPCVRVLAACSLSCATDEEEPGYRLVPSPCSLSHSLTPCISCLAKRSLWRTPQHTRHNGALLQGPSPPHKGQQASRGSQASTRLHGADQGCFELYRCCGRKHHRLPGSGKRHVGHALAMATSSANRLSSKLGHACSQSRSSQRSLSLC